MEKEIKIALVAHDNMKRELAEWVEWNWEKLMDCPLVCTGTTGRIVGDTIKSHTRTLTVPNITLLKSGPLGGDQQMGSLIAEGKIRALIFFWDPMSAQPHDVDVKALLRLATLYNIPTAINRTSADFIISSPLFDSTQYQVMPYDFTSYVNRTLK